MYKKILSLMFGLMILLSACSSSQVIDEAGEIQKIKLPMGFNSPAPTKATPSVSNE